MAISLINNSLEVYLFGIFESVSLSKSSMFFDINCADGNKNPPLDMLTVRYLPAKEYKWPNDNLCIRLIYLILNLVRIDSSSV